MDKAVAPARAAPSGDPNEPVSTCTALKRGAAQERVTDANIDAPSAMARQHGAAQLEVLRREWRTACGVDPLRPTLPPAVSPAS